MAGGNNMKATVPIQHITKVIIIIIIHVCRLVMCTILLSRFLLCKMQWSFFLPSAQFAPMQCLILCLWRMAIAHTHNQFFLISHGLIMMYFIAYMGIHTIYTIYVRLLCDHNEHRTTIQHNNINIYTYIRLCGNKTNAKSNRATSASIQIRVRNRNNRHGQANMQRQQHQHQRDKDILVWKRKYIAATPPIARIDL